MLFLNKSFLFWLSALLFFFHFFFLSHFCFFSFPSFLGAGTGGFSFTMATMLPEGQVTATIYGLIKEEKFDDAILILAGTTKKKTVLIVIFYWGVCAFVSSTPVHAQFTK